MLEIEKGIPIQNPRKYNNGGGRQKYPFVDMEPGDSVFIEGAKSHENNACRAARAAASRKGYSMAFRFYDDGARIWRIS